MKQLKEIKLKLSAVICLFLFFFFLKKFFKMSYCNNDIPVLCDF